MKKLLSFFLSVCMVLTLVPAFSVGVSATSATRPYDTQPLGDVNADQLVNAKDVLLLRKYISSERVTMDTAHADITRDKAVNMKDILAVRKTVVGLLLTTTAFLADNVPAYQNSPSVAIKGNMPDFSSSELTRSAYETYSALDKLGRCGLCISCIGQELMPTEARGDISSVYPTGWIQGKYSVVSGGYLYNRCHLIGFQLTGENANVKNLITGTKYLNNDGMLPFENKVADYIHSTGNHVLYRVEPIFVGKDLLARGVQMEAMSVEDNGAGIRFNVFCYNVQKGITLDYASGGNRLTVDTTKKTTTTTKKVTTTTKKATTTTKKVTTTTKKATTTTKKVTTTTKKATSPTYAPLGSYVHSKSSKVFHRPDCYHIGSIKEANRIITYDSRDTLIAAGYSPCKDCNP